MFRWLFGRKSATRSTTESFFLRMRRMLGRLFRASTSPAAAPEGTVPSKPAVAFGWDVIDCVVPILTIAKDALSGNPFQGVVAGPLQVLKTLQTNHSNNDRLNQLVDRLEEIRAIIDYTTPDKRQSFPTRLKANCEIFSNALEEIARNLNDLKARNLGHKYFAHEVIAGALESATARINAALQQFNAAGSIQTQIELGKQARMNLLTTCLSHEPDSNYNSKTENGEPHVCFENTRTEILKMIYEWFEAPDSKPFFWLSGMAGTGKSTIARTVAKHLEDKNMLGGSFFFSKWEFHITDPFAVFPNLAYQLCLRDDSFFEHINQSPATIRYVVTSRSLEKQFNELILEPLKKNQSRYKSLMIIIDALDEGDEDATCIISHLERGISLLPFRLKVLVTSRRQSDDSSLSVPTASSAFQDFQLHNIEASIVQNDIRHYLSSKLGALGIPPPWPTPEDMAALVSKAKNLFIFATTAVNFIGDRRWSNPQKQLERLLLTTADEHTHWHELDAMYRRVLEDALPRSDKALVARFQKVVGAIILLRSPLSVASLEALLDIQDPIAIETVALLHSVFIVPDEHADPKGIRSFHPSFPEFLVKRCSTQDPFYINEKEHHTRLAMLCLRYLNEIEEHPMDRLDGYPIPLHVKYACLHWSDHVSNALANDDLLGALDIFSRQYLLRWVELLHYIKHGWQHVYLDLIQFREWAKTLDGRDDLVMLLNDAIWFVPAYLDSAGLRLRQCGRDEEGRMLWSSAEAIYQTNCMSFENVKRHAVFHPREGGGLYFLFKVPPNGRRQVEEALEVFREAANMRASWVANGPDTLRFEVCYFFYRLSSLLYGMKHLKVALDVTEKAIFIYRALVDNHPDVPEVDPDDTDGWVRRFAGIQKIDRFPNRAEVSFQTHKVPAAYPSRHPGWFLEKWLAFNWRVCVCAESQSPGRGLEESEKTVVLCRSLAADRPRVFRKALALSLNNLGFSHYKTGDLEKGLPVMEEAVSVYRDLATIHRDKFREELATLLNNVGIFCREVENFEKGLIAAEEASSFLRDLAAIKPDIFRQELVTSLGNLVYFHFKMGNFEKGLLVAEEAVSICRDSADIQPFRALLVPSLNNLSCLYSKRGNFDKGLLVAEEAVLICRESAADAVSRGWLELLALLLNNLGWRLQALGRCSEALEFAQESLELTRALAAGELAPSSFQAHLPDVLDTAVVSLQKLDRHDEAQQLGHKTVDIGWPILETGPGDVEMRESPLESLKRMKEVYELRKEIASIKQGPQACDFDIHIGTAQSPRLGSWRCANCLKYMVGFLSLELSV
ncbi:hypothetical protein F5887DRAFT_1112022 [Amanita rubescens]|nr:hypothetical protein F5887DRAFT_1112022 [Amanita rubescens]